MSSSSSIVHQSVAANGKFMAVNHTNHIRILLLVCCGIVSVCKSDLSFTNSFKVTISILAWPLKLTLALTHSHTYTPSKYLLTHTIIQRGIKFNYYTTESMSRLLKTNNFSSLCLAYWLDEFVVDWLSACYVRLSVCLLLCLSVCLLMHKFAIDYSCL